MPVLKVIRSGAQWKIKNVTAKKVYKTKYDSKIQAERKVRIMKEWFFRR